MSLVLADRTVDLINTPFRKLFELSKQLKEPLNLGLGQPDFDVPEPLKQIAIDAITRGMNSYTVASGLPELREMIRTSLNKKFNKADDVIITSGTMGALLLVLQSVVNPGDNVILLDPYFVGYPHLVRLVEGNPIYISTYPNLQPDPDLIRKSITPKTKAILLCNPGNPTGVLVETDRLQALAQIADEMNILLIADEIYSSFVYDVPFVSTGALGANVMVCSSFSKTHGMTGWRIGYAYGPPYIIQAMTGIQQSTFVCAPSMAQVAATSAWTFPMDNYVDAYRKKRDYIVQFLDKRYEMVHPGGGFYVYPKVPSGTAMNFVELALQHNLIVMPGSCFSQWDTHFRISYVVDDSILKQGIATLNDMLNKLPQGSVVE